MVGPRPVRSRAPSRRPDPFAATRRKNRRMGGYLLRRTAWAAAVFLAVTLATYITFFVVGERTPQAVQGLGAQRREIQRAERLRGLDRPVLVQYVDYLKQLGHGSLGES